VTTLAIEFILSKAYLQQVVKGNSEQRMNIRLLNKKRLDANYFKDILSREEYEKVKKMLPEACRSQREVFAYNKKQNNEVIDE
jgi:hypothetical protein